MRSQAPVCRVTLPDGRDGWLVTQYESVRRVLQDHARFSNRSMLGQAVEMPEITPQGRAVIGLSSDVMLGCDPPKHSRLREPVGKAFTPRLVESLRPYIAALAEELLDAVEARALRDGDRTIDLISDYAFLLNADDMSMFAAIRADPGGASLPTMRAEVKKLLAVGRPFVGRDVRRRRAEDPRGVACAGRG